VDFGFGHRNAVKDGNSLLLYPVAQRTAGNQLTNLTERAPVLMFVFVVMRSVFMLVMMMSMIMGCVVMVLV